MAVCTNRDLKDVQQGMQGGRETLTEAGGTGQPQPPAAAGAVTGTSRFQQQGSLICQQRSRHVLPVCTSLTAAGHTNQREHNQLLTRHGLKGSKRSKVTYASSPSKFLKRAISASLGTCHLYLLSPPPQHKKQVPALCLPQEEHHRIQGLEQGFPASCQAGRCSPAKLSETGLLYLSMRVTRQTCELRKSDANGPLSIPALNSPTAPCEGV